MDAFMKQNWVWNWNGEEAPETGEKFIAYIPTAKEGNRIQRVRCVTDQGVPGPHPEFVNEHGNRVEFDAFIVFRDPELERGEIAAFNCGEDDLVLGGEQAVFADELSHNNASKKPSHLPFLVGVTLGVFVAGVVIPVLAALF